MQKENKNGEVEWSEENEVLIYMEWFDDLQSLE